jgi:hypothetical protein
LHLRGGDWWRGERPQLATVRIVEGVLRIEVDVLADIFSFSEIAIEPDLIAQIKMLVL